jgi:hypothetical protein
VVVYRAPPMKECTMQQHTKDDYLTWKQVHEKMAEKGLDKIDVATFIAFGYEREHLPRPVWTHIDPDLPERGMEPRWQALAVEYFLDRVAERRAMHEGGRARIGRENITSLTFAKPPNGLHSG